MSLAYAEPPKYEIQLTSILCFPKFAMSEEKLFIALEEAAVWTCAFLPYTYPTHQREILVGNNNFAIFAKKIFYG